jgi:hypothetical protein
MKLWIDDVRPAPEGYVWVKAVNTARLVIMEKEKTAQWASDQAYALENVGNFEMARRIGRVAVNSKIELIDIDHDAGDYAADGGDYIKLLDWLEETGRNYPIRIHSMNVVGRMNMEAICRRNGWTIVE